MILSYFIDLPTRFSSFFILIITLYFYYVTSHIYLRIFLLIFYCQSVLQNVKIFSLNVKLCIQSCIYIYILFTLKNICIHYLHSLFKETILLLTLTAGHILSKDFFKCFVQQNTNMRTWLKIIIKVQLLNYNILFYTLNNYYYHNDLI